jgi:hypothetical protein
LQGGIASFQISSSEPRGQTGFVISRLERDGVVQPRNGVEIRAGEQVAGLRIVLAFGSGGINGTVKWDNGPVPSDVHLLVRLTKPGDNSYGIRPQEIDARGKFAFQSVPAGTYDLNLNIFNQSGRPRQAGVRQSVTVSDGTVTEVEMLVDSVSNPAPVP